MVNLQTIQVRMIRPSTEIDCGSQMLDSGGSCSNDEVANIVFQRIAITQFIYVIDYSVGLTTT